LHRLVIVAPGDQDRILGAFDLALQRQEVLVGLEVGIGFLQPLQRNDRLGQPALGVVEGANLGRIVEVVRAQLNLARIGALPVSRRSARRFPAWHSPSPFRPDWE
jgi:hypothetical protein